MSRGTIKLCAENDHGEVRYTDDNCPACYLAGQIEERDQEIDRLRDQIKSLKSAAETRKEAQ